MRVLSTQERIVRFRKRVLFISVIFTCILILSLCFSINSKAEESKDIYKYYTSYEIKAGDSLWSIADSFMTPEFNDKEAYINEIKSMNHLLDDNLTAGEYIIVSYYSDEVL